MSYQVTNWLWEHSTAKGSALLLLLAIGSHAHPDGTGAYPSVATLAAKTRLTERAVRQILAQLTTQGLIHIHPGGGRISNRYDIIMTPKPITTVIHNPVIHTPEKFSGHPGSPLQGRGAPSVLNRAEEPPYKSPPTSTRPPVGPQPDSPHHPTTGGGGHHQIKPHPHSAQPPHQVPLPAPSVFVNTTPSPALRNESPHHESLQQVLDAAATTHGFGNHTRTKLTAPVLQALNAGHSPETLTRELVRDPHGIRSPYAALTARLADLPSPAPPPPPKPPWCGTCDHRTRMTENPDGRPRRCTNCHPLAPGSVCLRSVSG